MAISYVEGDLFASPMRTLVCPTNCVGVMGAGLAKEFARRYPDACAAYNRDSKEGQYRPGMLAFCREPGDHDLLFLPTKRHWKNPSELGDIIAGLSRLRFFDLSSLAVPALGCGLGGLDWNVVRPVMEHHLSELNIPVEIYPPKER